MVVRGERFFMAMTQCVKAMALSVKETQPFLVSSSSNT